MNVCVALSIFVFIYVLGVIGLYRDSKNKFNKRIK